MANRLKSRGKAAAASAGGADQRVDRGNGLRTVDGFVGASGPIPGVGSSADSENVCARPRAAAAGGNATLYTSRAPKACV